MELIILTNGQQTTTDSLVTSFMGYSVQYTDIDLYTCVSTTTVIVPGDTSTMCLSSTQPVPTNEQTTTVNIQSTEKIAYTTVTTTEKTTVNIQSTAQIAYTTVTTTEQTTVNVKSTERIAYTTLTTTTVPLLITSAIASRTTAKSVTLSTVSSTSASIFVPPTCLNETIGSSCNISLNTCDMSQPCLNLATCYPNMTVPLGYVCACITGFSGLNCEVDERSCRVGSTCLNSGTCNTTGNASTCVCALGRTGVHCEYEVDVCSNITCQNNGICVSNYGNWSCLCISSELYSGTYCQVKSSSLRTKEIVSRSFAGIAIGCLAAVVGFVLIMDILKYCFNIDPVENDFRSWKEKKAEQRREERRQERKRKNKVNPSKQPVLAVRFQYIHA